MSDADGDSTMHSSPETGVLDDDMFPEGPSTPKNPAAYALDPANELSPPHSQGAAIASEINANGKRVLRRTGGPGGASSISSPNTLHTDSSTGYQWSKQEDQPGYEWKNARAREDVERALDNIVDKESQIKTKYGDPLKADVPMRLGR